MVMITIIMIWEIGNIKGELDECGFFSFFFYIAWKNDDNVTDSISYTIFPMIIGHLRF